MLVVVLCHRQVAQHAGRVLPAEPRRLRTDRARDEFATGRLHHQPVRAAEPAGYPTLCKGRFSTEHGTGYIFEDPVSLDATTLLAGLRDAGVAALKIEGRQRGRAYVESVVRHFRRALDALESGREADIANLRPFTEGQASTLGAYRKTWR